MPSASSAIIYNVLGSEKTIIAGKSSGPYGHMLQLNYNDNYLRILRYSAGSWKTDDWEKISAGHADTATYATSSGSCSGNSATATKATQDSDGNIINTTYLKRSGGTVTGNVTFNSSVTTDSLTTEDLIVNGSARFVSGLTGDLVGNVTGNLTGTASYATNAGSAASAGNANTIGGISISKLVYGSNSTKTTDITEDQLNAPLASGFYTITNTTTGSSATIPNATSVSMILHTSYSGLDNNAGFDLLINDSTTSSLHFRPATGAGKGA